MDSLVERLTAMYSHRGDGIPTQYVNPDGPEAAEEIARLREALEDIKHQAETRIADGDEMGARVWRIALVDILAEARSALGSESKT